jgi:lipopolysaccharide export LptBFGC system permease protein LptF
MQFKAMLFVSFFTFCLIFLFNFAEMTRKFPISTYPETLFTIKLALLKVPATFCEVLHYLYFITATFSLWSLCNSNQMTILKSSGKSPQQILFPFVSFAFCMAMFWLFAAHPYGKISNEIYNQTVFADSSDHGVNENIWVDYTKENQVIFIKKILNNNIDGLFIFDTKRNKRIFAKRAIIGEKWWDLRNVTIIDQNNNCIINSVDKLVLYNNISFALIKILAKPPANHDVYQLRKIYKIQKRDQIKLRFYELELHKLLANCVSFILFALIAGIICFPINRYKTKTNIAIKVIGSAFILRFANNMSESLAYSGVFSVKLASWAIILALLCISTALLVWREA